MTKSREPAYRYWTAYVLGCHPVLVVNPNINPNKPPKSNQPITTKQSIQPCTRATYIQPVALFQDSESVLEDVLQHCVAMAAGVPRTEGGCGRGEGICQG